MPIFLAKTHFSRPQFTSDITQYAKWDPNTYKVTFSSGTGYTITAKKNGSTFTSGSTVTITDTVTFTITASTGYTAGSLTKTSGTATFSNNVLSNVQSNVVISGSATQNSYTITVYHYLQDIGSSGYTLDTTHTVEDLTYGDKIYSSDEYKYYAHFTYNSSMSDTSATAGSDSYLDIYYSRDTYTVTFNANGGSGSYSATVQYNATYSIPSGSTTGITKTGWLGGSMYPAGFNTSSDAIYTISSITVTGDTTLYAIWEYRVYVEYGPYSIASNPGNWARYEDGENGGDYLYTDVIQGNAIHSSSFPTLGYSGWTFDGYEEGTYFTVNSHVSLTPKFYKNVTLTLGDDDGTISITLDSNWTKEQGSAAEYHIYTKIYYGDTITLPTNDPTRTGYRFDGWVDSSGNAISNGDAFYSNGRAKWIQLTTITLNLNCIGASCSSSGGFTGGWMASDGNDALGGTFDVGTVITSLPTPTRGTMTFEGWYTAKTGGTKVTSITVGTSNTTYYAQWTQYYTIILDTNTIYGTISDSAWSKTGAYEWTRIVASGTTISLPTPEYTSLSESPFGGWSDENENDFDGGDNYTVTSDVKLSAWAYMAYNIYLEGLSYYVTVSGTTGKVPFTIVSAGSYTKWGGDYTQESPAYDFTRLNYSGSTYGTLPTITQKNYTYYFAINGTKIDDSTVVSLNHVAYDNVINVDILRTSASSGTIYFDANGGSCSTTSKTVTFGSAIGSLPIATRTGYTFLGWYTGTSGGTQITSSTVIYADSQDTYYAQWSSESYTITLYCNGGSGYTESGWTYNYYSSEYTKEIEYGDTLGTLPDPTRSGYKFDGWYTSSSGGYEVDSSTTVYGSESYYAQWTQDTVYYTLTVYYEDYDTEGTICEPYTEKFTAGTTVYASNYQYSITDYTYKSRYPSNSSLTMNGDRSWTMYYTKDQEAYSGTIYYQMNGSTVDWESWSKTPSTSGGYVTVYHYAPSGYNLASGQNYYTRMSGSGDIYVDVVSASNVTVTIRDSSDSYIGQLSVESGTTIGTINEMCISEGWDPEAYGVYWSLSDIEGGYGGADYSDTVTDDTTLYLPV